MALLKYFCPVLPTKVPFLTEREVQEANAGIKEVLEDDIINCVAISFGCKLNLVDGLSRPPN